MNNIILELNNAIEEVRRAGADSTHIRVRLKEVLHYFVLDALYNSSFKSLVFYGGTCLRVLYGLPRMSEDLDFEGVGIDAKKLCFFLEDYFRADIPLAAKGMVKQDETICRITLSFPVMYELGLSSHKEETLRITVETRLVSKEYANRLQPIFTPKTGYGRSFIIRHYDLPTLFASKLAAILERHKKGFTAGGPVAGIDYKGRDFYDLIWYMERGVLPNQEMLAVNKITAPVGDIFDEISVFIAERDMKKGLQKNLASLLESRAYAENFVERFGDMFSRLKKERYTARKVERLQKVVVDENLGGDNTFVFRYATIERPVPVVFTFKLTWEFLHYGGTIPVAADIAQEDNIFVKNSVQKGKEERIKQYVQLFKDKIDDYLKRNNNEVYFEQWQSKLICRDGMNFNPEKEIKFARGEDLLNKKVTLETLAQ